ncbi:MAG: biotin--[acetyl-CoA-carboxylase] ligase [Aquificaceae bacterium]|jgi:BirA family biotin operon repressor/biotin-[acetyl-CoA-carboxylase] ligase|uniref:biotin--[acetyl-CoA-carboxylase] ligase n=1 Tax=Hydrogenobacter sp. Uz 6-8 TaxID=3384828 RepID=UPI000F2B35F2|nr:MAG: biotin--[acetyl-CoA-carboxylase] ligase [Aquificota bacterium]
MLKSLIWLEELPSTQDFLKEKNFPEGTVVVANRQTSGRGRLGRSWHSPEGGLYFSLSLPVGIRDEMTLPLVVAHSVAHYLKKLGFMPAIKWVNDVYVGGKKVCGVLTERLRERILLGVGINLNQESFPEWIDGASLRMLSGKTYQRVDFLLELLTYLEGDLKRLQQEGFGAFRKEIEERLLFKESEVILYTPEPLVGILQGIGEDGSLLLQTQDGLKSFSVGEITLRAF